MSAPPDGYRHHTPVTIRYGDMDTLGHVNNAKYLTYIEQSRVRYFHENQLWDGSLSALGLILARVTIEYQLPLAMADGTADVWTRVSRLGNKSFDMQHVVIRSRDGEVAATGQTVMVVYDYQASAPVPMPGDWRDRLIAYEPILQQ